MAVTLEIIPIPLGSQFGVYQSQPSEINDFSVLLVFSDNVTGLTAESITLSAGAQLMSLTGEHSVYKAVIRPKVTTAQTAQIRVTLAADAVNEGNAATHQNIRISQSFPDTDAAEPTPLFSYPSETEISRYGLVIRPERIDILCLGRNNTDIRRFTHAGTEIIAERVRGIYLYQVETCHAINGYYLARNSNTYSHRYDLTFNRTGNYNFSNASLYYGRATHNRLGILGVGSQGALVGFPTTFSTKPTGAALEAKDYGQFSFNNPIVSLMATGDRIIARAFPTAADAPGSLHALQVTDSDAIEYRGQLNISLSAETETVAVHRERLYTLKADAISTLDLMSYSPVRAKQHLPVIFATAGGRLKLTEFAPNAERIVFDVGFLKPSYLSIDRNELRIAQGTTGTQTALVKCLGINYSDAHPFSFYIVIAQTETPIWREVPELTMRAGSRFDLFQIVEGAETIAFQSGQSQPQGSQLSDGIFEIGTTGGVATFTASKGGNTADIAIQIDVIQQRETIAVTDTFRYKVEIEGIDVTTDLAELPSISESLDPIVINEYQVNEASVVLRNDAGKYSDAIAGNFWQTHRLNACGFQNRVKMYVEHSINGNWTSTLLFSGLILETFAPIGDVTFRLNCVDISAVMRNANVQDFGNLEKWDVLNRRSDEPNFEGIYIPNRSLLPMQPETVSARVGETELTISPVPLPSEGPPLKNIGYVTDGDLRTAGGYLADPPLAKFKTSPRAFDAQLLMSQLSANKQVYNTEMDIPGTVVDPFLLNRGNAAFRVEKTQTTRTPVDWVFDSTQNRLLILLSNPEGHLSDLLLQYDRDSDRYRVLYEFDKSLATHRIERSDATNYYILTSKAITTDRSTTGAMTADVGYGYDSRAEGSQIKIWHYNATAGTLSEHVSETDTYPPQLGIHYPVGFENTIRMHLAEGNVPEYRGAFKWVSDHLYYRYATDAAFGIARANASGTTAAVITATASNQDTPQNHMNFAFDVAPNGTVYFVYATGDPDESTLIIKQRTRDGTESTILQENKTLSELTDIDGSGGAYLGAHECLLHGNELYILAPVQLTDSEEDDTLRRSINKGAGTLLCRCNVTSDTPSLQVLESYPFVQWGACNLTLHDGAVHFIEHPPAAAKFMARNPDLETYNSELGYNLLAEHRGHLKRIESTGLIEALGNLWYTDRPYNIAATRCLSISGDLHITMGYGNPDDVLRPNSGASAADNYTQIVYGRKLRYVLPEFQPSGSIYDSIAALAKKVNATLSFERNIIRIVERSAYRAETAGTTGTGTDNLHFDNANKTLPNSGYLLIGKEILQYSGTVSGAFTGIRRGVLGSAITEHADGTEIIYLNNIIRGDYKQITVQSDTNRIRNIIRDPSGVTEVRDAESIAMYGERPYTLDLGLTRHERVWIEEVFKQYLSELKDLRELVNIETVPDFSLELGQIVAFFYEDMVTAMRIVSIRYESTGTHIRGRTV